MIRAFGLVLVAMAYLVPVANADEIRVAVASNFHSTLNQLAESFERQTGHRLLISPASTSQHFAQIINGAPFDLWLAADKARPAELERRGVGIPNSRVTYALGRLVLWAPAADENRDLKDVELTDLAIANPELAPYGEAAKQWIDRQGPDVSPRLIMGENVAQTFQFVASGALPAGLVSMAQVLALPDERRGWYREIPPAEYSTIEQQMLLLTPSDSAISLYRYLQTDASRALIEQAGYRLPEPPTERF